MFGGCFVLLFVLFCEEMHLCVFVCLLLFSFLLLFFVVALIVVVVFCLFVLRQ